DDTARIEIIGDEPLIDDCQFDDACRFSKSLFRRAPVTTLGFESKVSGPIVPYLRSTWLERSDSANDVRQCLPVDLQRLGGVLRRIDTVSHHKSNRIVDVPHGLFRQ